MSVWWDKDKSDKPKGITCKHCVTHPELVQTGYADPKSLKCPVCKNKYNSSGKLFDPSTIHSETLLEMEEEMQETWESIWGQTKAP